MYGFHFPKADPLIPAVGKMEGLVTNSILESYGRQLEDLCSTMENRVYDLPETGLKMSIPVVNADEFKQIIQDVEK